MVRMLVCPQPALPQRREVVVHRPVIRERPVQRYIERYEPPPPPPPPRPKIVIRDRRPRPRPPPPPPAPPIIVMPQSQQCCHQQCCTTVHGHVRPAPREPRPRSSPTWLGRIDMLDDESLAAAATIAAAALAAPDDEPPAEDFIECECPRGVCPGDTIQVRLPSEAGGGCMCVVVPECVRPGETFEVPLGTTHRARARRSRRR